MPVTRARELLKRVRAHPLAERLKRLGRFLPSRAGGGLRLLLAALCGAGILHIVATLAAPGMIATSAYDRVAPTLPLHQVKVLPAVTPSSQPLPFLTPAWRYALCRYDTGRGPVSVSAQLPGPGWSVALHTPSGSNIYASTGQDGRPIELRLKLVPSAERFGGLTPESLGVATQSENRQRIETAEGIVVLRAPDRGSAFAPFIEAAMRSFRCSADAF